MKATISKVRGGVGFSASDWESMSRSCVRAGDAKVCERVSECDSLNSGENALENSCSFFSFLSVSFASAYGLLCSTCVLGISLWVCLNLWIFDFVWHGVQCLLECVCALYRSQGSVQNFMYVASFDYYVLFICVCFTWVLMFC